jgi:hypothetical protein
MANKDAAFGLKPIGKVGQNADNGGLSEYSIANNDTTAIYFQDAVKVTAAGTIDTAAAGDGNLAGSLNGVFYTDPSSQKPTWANHYAGSIAASDTVAFVADDPYERFEIQCNSTLGAADVFANANITYLAGNSANYVSKSELNKATLDTTNTLQLKIVGISKDPENNDTASANVNAVVQINLHYAKSTTGVL